MKIAFVLESPLRYGGGVSAVVRTLMEGLPESYRLILISRDAPGALDGDPLIRRVDMHIPFFGQKEAPHPEFFRTSKPILEKLRKAGPDLVHFHSGGVYSWGNRWPGASWPAALKKEGIRSVWTNHLVVRLLHGYCGDQKPFWFKMGMLPFSYLGKFQQVQSVSAEICVSEHDAAKLRRWHFPLQGRIIRLYHSRLEQDQIIFSTAPREKIILSVGHLAYRKGQHILVQAFAKLARNHPDWNLVLIGPESADGCAGWIREFCKKEKLEGKVSLAGSREDVQEWMRRCSIYVQPSLQEALGLALQEAMATGAPCVGAKVGGIPELIQDNKTGLLFQAGHVGQLVLCLEKLILRPELGQAFGLSALKRLRALRMNKETMISAHKSIYRKL